MTEAYAQTPWENREKLSKKILIADDDEGLLKLSNMILKREGYDIKTVGNGKELLDLILSGEKFDVVLTDNNMDEMTGLEVLKALRANPEFKYLPVVLRTAKHSAELQKEVEALGAVFLKKPHSPDELKRALEEASERIKLSPFAG